MQEYTGAAKYSMYTVYLSIPNDRKSLNIQEICELVNKKHYAAMPCVEKYPYYINCDTAKAIFVNYLINGYFDIYYMSHGLYYTIQVTAHILYNEQEKRAVAIAAHTLQNEQSSDYPEIMWYE